MGGFFGTIKHSDCVNDLYYGIDYNFHLGTKRGGMITLNENNIFIREFKLFLIFFRFISSSRLVLFQKI